MASTSGDTAHTCFTDGPSAGCTGLASISSFFFSRPSASRRAFSASFARVSRSRARWARSTSFGSTSTMPVISRSTGLPLQSPCTCTIVTWAASKPAIWPGSPDLAGSASDAPNSAVTVAGSSGFKLVRSNACSCFEPSASPRISRILRALLSGPTVTLMAGVQSAQAAKSSVLLNPPPPAPFLARK